MDTEAEIKKIKVALRYLAETLAYSEARGNTANERVEGQFMRQVETFMRGFDNILK